MRGCRRPLRVILGPEVDTRLPEAASFGVDKAAESKRKAVKRVRHRRFEESCGRERLASLFQRKAALACCAICAGFASLLFLGMFVRFQTARLTTAIPVWNCAFSRCNLSRLWLGAAVCVTAACGNVHSCAREPDTSHWATTSLGNFYCKSEIKRSCAIGHGIFSSSFVVICSARGARAAGGLAAGDCVSVPPLPSSLHSRRGVNTVLQYV